MRNDMSKVIVERPRLGGGKSRKGREIDPDLQVSHEGMRKPYVRNYTEKSLNENLAPLRRFLFSQVGKRWDDVYSDVAKNLRTDNTVQQHVRDHLEDFVAVRTSLKDGKIMVSSKYGWYDYIGDTRKLLYVDPDDGILKINKFEPARRRYTYGDRVRDERIAREASEKVFPDGTHIKLVDGIWYQVEYADIPKNKIITVKTLDGTETKQSITIYVFDAILKTRVSYQDSPYSQRRTTYCVSKRQLSKTELKKYKVVNG